MSVKDREGIHKAILAGHNNAAKLRALGYTHNSVSEGLRWAVMQGLVEQMGKGTQTHYVPIEKPKPKKVKSKTDYSGPDLPDDLLFLMGYTRHRPQEIGRVYGLDWHEKKE